MLGGEDSLKFFPSLLMPLLVMLKGLCKRIIQPFRKLEQSMMRLLAFEHEKKIVPEEETELEVEMPFLWGYARLPQHLYSRD